MKTTFISKINPKIKLTFPVLLQCKSGECGGCPNNTGKLLWIPKLWNVGDVLIFNFQYNFFNKNEETEGTIKFNAVESNNPFGDRPDKAYSTATPIQDTYMAPSQMKLGNTLEFGLDVYQSGSVGLWVYFKQLNPAIGVHDALCFEYNHEKRLITFRSF